MLLHWAISSSRSKLPFLHIHFRSLNCLERDPSVRTGSAPNYPTAEGQATDGSTYAEGPSTGYTSQVTGGAGTNAPASGWAGEPLGQGNLTGTAEHQHGIQGGGLTRESMTGQTGTGHQFGEITDHNR
jgi:hypothetical protein